jgi:hypothetical protein
MRVAVDWRSSQKSNYNDFIKKNPTISLSFDEWKNIIYGFSEMFKEHLLETGDKGRLPMGLGEFAINKKKRKRLKGLNDEFINLPIDWKKTKEKGKYIYNFNYHTEGYYFGWIWFKNSTRFKLSDLWYFKPSRVTSRLLAHYLNVDEKYKDLYKEWKM